MPSRPISWWRPGSRVSSLTNWTSAETELKSAGFTNPTIRDFDDQPLDIKAIDKPVNVLMDLEPRNPDTTGLPGRAL